LKIATESSLLFALDRQSLRDGFDELDMRFLIFLQPDETVLQRFILARAAFCLLALEVGSLKV